MTGWKAGLQLDIVPTHHQIAISYSGFLGGSWVHLAPGFVRTLVMVDSALAVMMNFSALPAPKMRVKSLF
jgi:hypothetical protein